MRRTQVALALGALALGFVPVAHADGVGCCDVECHSSDGAGRGTHSMQRRLMTQADCESAFPECEVRWSPEACDAVGRGMGVVRQPEEGEE